MKFMAFFSVLLLELAPFTAHAQESRSDAYDHALLKREYIGKNEVFAVTYKNDGGKANRVDGYIRASANVSNITVYVYNTANRNYDLFEIPMSSIVSIGKSESQKIPLADKHKIFSTGSILKAAGIILISGAIALFFFHDEL